MPLDRNKLKQLYSTLQKGGYSQSYDQFENGFTGNNNYANRKKVYDLLTANGAQIGNSYEDFMKRIYTPGATPQRQAPQQRRAAPAKPSNNGSGFQFDPNFGKQSHETFFNGGRQTHVGGKYDPIEAGRRQYRASQANNPTVKRQAAQGNPHAKKAVEQGVKAQKEIEGEEAQSRQRRTGQTPQQQARVDASLQIDPEKASKRIQQKMDEAAYMAETGKELKNPVEIGTKIGENGEVIGDPLIAPTLARDENGNIQRGANGEPLIGASSDAERTNAYKQTLVERQKPTIDERIKEAEEERERLEEQLKKRGAELDAQNEGSVWRDLPRGGGAGVHTINSTDVNGRNTDTEYLDLLAAQKKVDEQLQDLKAARDEKTGTFLGGAWRGFRDYAFDLSNWDGGYRDLLTSSAMLRSKYGVPKTKREKAAERSMMENTYKADNAAQEAEDALGYGYRFMRIGAQSLPFALNFMAGNLTGITSGIARAGEALGVKAARNIAIKQGANNILRNLCRSVLRNTGVMLGDLGASTALTTTMQAGQTASDICNRHVGNVTYDPKADDHNLENGKSLGRSIYEGVANSTIENYTEMLGEHMHFGKFAKWGLNKIGLGKVSDWFTKVCKTDFMQGVNKYLEMGGFNGYPQEVAEEEVGIPLHAIFDGGNQFSDLKDKRQQLDILGGMLFSMAGMGAGSLALNAGGKVAHKAGMAIQYQQDQHNLNNADKVASFRLTDEKWQPLKEKIDDTTNDDFGKVMSGILSDKSLAPQEKSAVWDYAQRMLIMRGHNMGQVAATKNGMTDQATNASNESYEAGYNAGSEDLNRIKVAYANARSQAEQTFSPEDLKKIDDDPVSYLRDLGDGEGSQYTRQAVMEYSNAKTAYDGMIQRAKDDLDSKLQDVNMTIDSHVQSADNGGDGMIHPITMKVQNDNGTDKKAYIISGNVVMTDDGTMVDDKKSSPSIIIRNEDGSIEMTSPDRILSVDEPLDPETERKQAVESVQQQFAQERANEIDSTLGFAEGDNYQVIGSDNAEHSVNVIQDNGDGTVTAVWDGHTDQPVQLSKDDVQQMSDAYRSQQYSQEQEEANQEEKEAESQEQQPDEQEAEDELPAGTPRETISYEPDMEMKPEVGNSVYVTDKDGNMVHGEVTQTDDLEGKYLVRTDKKVNGKLVQPFNQEEILYEVHRMKPQEEESPQIIDSGENGGESGGVNGGENTDEEQKPQRAIDLIPSQEVDDGKGNVRTVHQWEQAEPGNTYDALTEIYHGNADRVKKGIDNRVGKIDKAIKGVQKKMDAIDNSDDFDEVAAQAEQYDQLQQQKQALQDEKKYWQKVQAVPVTRRGIDIERQKAAAKARAEEERKKAEEAFEQRRREEEAQRQAAEAEAQKAAAEKVNYGSSAEDAVPSSPAEKRHAELEKAKSSSELRTIAKRIYGDDVIGDEEPRTVEELVASNLVPHSLNFEGKTVNGVQQRGVSQELGMERRGIGNGSDTNPINYWLAPTGQGLSVNQAAHEIWESRPPQMQSVDTEEIKNALLDLLQTATKPRDISDLILRNRIDEAEQMLAADEEREQAAKEQEAWQHDQEVKTITDMLQATVADWNVTPKMEDIINSEVIDETYEDAMIALHRDDDLIEALELINNDNGQNENAEGTGLGEESQRRATERGTAQGEGTVQGEESNQTRDGGSRAEQQGQSAGTEGRTGTAVRSNSSGAQAERSTGASQAEPSRVGEEERRNGIRLTREEAESFIDSMEQKADFPIELELTPTNWDKEFGTNGVVTTPLGAVKMGEHQYLKLARRGRNSKLGMIKPTLQHPDIIIEDHSEAKEGNTSERNSSYVFIKTFLKPDGTRYYYFTSITVSKDGMEVVVSNQEKSRNRILRLMTEGNVVWYTPKDVTTSSAEKQGLDYDQSYKAETESKGSGITPQHIPSSAKIAQLSRKDKEKAEKVSPEGEKSSIGATSAPEKVETERQGVNTEPSEKQKEAGNYKKGHIKVDGYDITIENPKGSVREKKDENGKVLWRTPMHYDYGYILGTKGTDGDHIDVYLSDTPTEGNVYVVDQIDQKTGDFDEHKVMYGFPSMDAARDAYKSQYEDGWKVGTITEVSREDFKKWVNSSHRKTKPFSEYKSVKDAAAKQPAELSSPTGTNGADRFHGKNGADGKKLESVEDVLDEVETRQNIAKYATMKADELRKREPDELRTLERKELAQADTNEQLAKIAKGEKQEKLLKDAKVHRANGELAGRIRQEVKAEREQLMEHRSNERKTQLTKREAALRNGVNELMREAGIEVIDDEKEGQRVLDMANGARLSKDKKRALETASPNLNGTDHQTVIPSADGAKVLKNLDTLVNDFENLSNSPKFFIGSLARALGAQKHGSNSEYATFETKNGRVVTIRLANHNAKISTFDNHNESDGISIVITANNNAKLTNDGNAHVTEFYYNALKLRRAEGKPLADIVRSIKQALYSGEFKDTTGLAERQEVNVGEIARQQRVYHGSAADFDAFDTMNHLSEGEGNQAFGAGTYVADQKDLGMKYANIAYDNDHNKQIAHWNGERLIKRFPTVEDFLNNPKTQEAMAKNGKTEAELRAYYDKQQKNAEAPRILYTVEIPDDNGKNYLDWDGELTREQADTIRKKLYDAVLARNDDYKGSEEYLAQDLSVIKEGGHIGDTYGTISDYLGSDKAASEFLHDLGYTGFKMHAAHNSSDKRYKNNWNYVIFNDKDLKITDKVRFFRTANGEAYGFTVGGKIYIDPRIATSETPIHEYAHLWAEALRKVNPKEWANVVELMKGCKEVWEQVTKEYPELETDDEIAEEVLAHYSGKRGAERLRTEAAKAADGAKSNLEKDKVKSAFSRLKDAIKRAWKHIAEDILHIHFTTAEEVADKVMYDLLNKVNPNRFNLSKSVEEGKDLIAVHNLTEDKLKQSLELGGFPMPSIAITKSSMGHAEYGDISLLFGKDTINPSDSRNKVYSGDAWNPTFPHVSYKLDEKKLRDIYSRALKAGNLPFFDSARLHPENLKDRVDGNDSAKIIESGKKDYGMKQMFLSEKGNPVKGYVQKTVDKYSPERVELLQEILDKIGVEGLRNGKYEDELKQIVGSYRHVDLDSVKPFFAKLAMQNALRDAIDFAENGNKKVENDVEATQKEIDSRVDPKEYDQWLHDMLEGIIEKKGIRNNTDPYTRSGDRLKWERLYDAVTLDNVLKAMKAQPAKSGGFFNSIFGASAKELSNLNEVREEAKRRIKSVPEEEFKAEKDKILSRLEKISLPSVERSNSISGAMDFVENVKDAVVHTHTPRGIYKYLSDIYPDMTIDVANEIADVVKDIQSMSTRYLEAKPYRAVGFDEVRAAVVPSDTEAKIVQQLKDKGIPVYTYEKGNAEERRQVVNDAAQEQSVKFHKAEFGNSKKAAENEVEAVNKRFNEELEKYKRGEVPIGTRFELGMPSKALESAGFPYLPISMRASLLSKKAGMERHPFEASDLRDLVKAMQMPIAIFKYSKDNMRNLIVDVKHGDKHFLVGITLDYKAGDIEVNSVSGLFPKESHEWIKWIQDGKAIRIDQKKKVLDLIDSLRTNPAESERIGLNLSSVAKIVEDFENPVIKGENLSFEGEDGSIKDVPTTPEETEENDVLYRIADDDEAAMLDKEPTVKVYRAMQLIDGKLYPPMSGRVKKQVKTKKGTMRTKWVWRDPIEVGKWEASEEHPEMANEDGTFTLDKGNGSTINAAYNPYIHTSRTPINDQFSSAWSRPELVTVEVEVPASELTSGYHAEKAKDATGEVEWKSGPVGREMAAQGKPRMVILSRWDKPVRIVPVDEVADEYAKRLAGTGITVPFNTVPPALRDALVAKGVTISEPEKGNAGQASRPSYEEWMKGNTRQRDGNGPYTDEELSMINDPFVRMLGESHRSKRQQKEFANRERQNMYDAVKDMAEKLHLDNVEIVTMSLEMTDHSGKVHHPKGFYNKANDKIIIVIPNHRNIEDALQTLLHEGVAHYGLRQLFGSHFDTFLRNVYEAGDMDVRRRIADLAIRKYQGDFSVATEEYLASLAEDTDFEDMNASWWQKIKNMFLAMLHDLGFDNFAGTHMFTLSDNELRYILWRSYENLKEPGRYRSILGEAEDITMQNHLGVGNYAEDKLERDLRQAYNNLDAAEINYQNYEAKKEEDPFRYNPKTAAIYKESVDFWKDKIAELENKHEPLDTEDEFEKERQEREEDAKRIKPRIVNTFRKWLKARRDWEKAVDANADNALELGDELNNMNDMMDAAMDAALDYGIDVSQLLKDNGIKDEDMVEWNDMFAGEPDFYSVVDEMYTNPNFDRSSHLRDRYDIGKTPEWMKKIGILGDNFSLSFKNIKTHQGKDADHDLTREEWHELPNAIQHPFLVTQYKGKNDRFRLYVNMVHNGHYVAVGVDVKRVNQGKNQPILEVNSIKTVFGHHGGITGDEKIIAYDEKITPEQQALLRGLNSHEYPTIQELQSGEDVIGKMSKPSPSDAVSNTSKSQLPNNNGRGMINAEGHKTSSLNAKISNNSDTNVNNSENVTEPAAWGKKDLMSKAEQVSYGIDPDLLFRDTIDDDDNTARETYNAWADAAITKLREAWQDSMINVKNLQDAVLKQRYEKIEDYENAYNAENRSHGVSRAEAEYFDDVIYKPLLKTVNKTAKEAGVSVGDVTEYMMAKHGLERNRVFAERDANAALKKYQEQQKAKYDEYAKTHPKGKLTQADFIKKSYDDFFNGYRERDYSGLTALTGTDNVQDAEAEAQRIVADMESRADTSDLWTKTWQATSWTLKKAFDSGIISRDNYDYVSKMFGYYIPFRGWDETTAGDIFDYVGSGAKDTAFSPTLHKAGGRKSQADNPLAYISQMAVSAIVQGNKNKVKQTFFNFVENHPTNLVSVSEMWYRNYGTVTDPDWREDVPYIPENATADEIADIIKKHDEDMEKLKQQGLATKQRGRLHLNVPVKKGQALEHHVEVMLNGKKYIMYINGNPRAAQALNGTRAHRASENSFESSRVANFGRKLAERYTSLSPAFTLSNALRDLTMAAITTLIKEDPKYAIRFRLNVAKLVGPARMFSLMRWYKKLGQSGLNGQNWLSDTQKYFYEFMTQGAETGFTSLKDIEDYKKDMAKEFGNMNQSVINPKRLFRGLKNGLEFANRCIEDMTRFAIYMASRQSGRSIAQSVKDAKNITLNFNRKGSGEMGNSTYRNLQIFINPAIQALQNIVKMAMDHPFKFGGVTGLVALVGVAQPLITQLLAGIFGGGDGDDDDWSPTEEYWKLPTWQRRNNFVFWIPGTKKFGMIPLAQEFRVFHGFGETLSTVLGNHSSENPGLEVLTQAADLLPLDFTGNNGNPLVNVAPTIVQPLLQIGFNTDFTGRPLYKDNDFNKYEPSFQKAYVGTPSWLIKSSQLINDVTGGNDHKQGAWERTKVGQYANNPAVIDHLLKGYYGGLYSFFAQLGGSIMTAASGETPDVQEVPIVNRVITTPRESQQRGKQQLPDWYFDMVDEAKRTQNELSGYKRDTRDKKEGALNHIEDMTKSEDFKKEMQINALINIVNQIRAAQPSVAEPKNKEEAETKQELDNGLKTVLGKLNTIRTTGKPLTDDEMNDQ